ncbi:hypothetical protein J2T49_000409 [Pseudomonas nitroreducens]|nr:hypothetical protein [Pseudomonas nitroreducens]MCP1684482.1 hypothetical protein [Pseudomonas nitroreducens]
MSDYGDQWRERRQYRQSKIAGYCVCGGSLLRTQATCYRCDSSNSYYKPKEKKP